MTILTTDCIIWTGAQTTLGYGVRTHNKRRTYVHRIAYCAANGLSISDIEGKVVRHKCDTPSCHNPEHLEIGTQADNMRDMRSRNRNVITPEIKQNMSAAQRKYRSETVVSEETKRRLSESHKGIKPSDETRAKMSAAQKGRKMSPESRQKMVDSWVIRKQKKES